MVTDTTKQPVILLSAAMTQAETLLAVAEWHDRQAIQHSADARIASKVKTQYEHRHKCETHEYSSKLLRIIAAKLGGKPNADRTGS